MSGQDTNPNTNAVSTEDYRKYPKGPNFLLIVILASVVLLGLLGGALLLLHKRAPRLEPHGPNAEPNSRLMLPADKLSTPSAV